MYKRQDLLGIDKEEESEIEVNPLTEEEQIEKELQDLQERKRLDQKREKRKKNEMKQKEITRMQMNMLTPMDIGIEAASLGKESLFNLKTAEKTGILDKLAKGKKRMLFTDEELAKDNDIHIDEELVKDRDDEAINTLISKLKGQSGDGKLSSKARMLFNDPIFDNVTADLPTANKDEFTSSESVGDVSKIVKKRKHAEIQEKSDSDSDSSDENESDNSDFELVANEDSDEIFDSDYDSEEERTRTKKEKHAQDIDIATVEAMTLAHQLALGQKTKHDLVNEGFNRYTFRDTENLPDWFIEEEKQHSKINRPITKEAALAIKEKMRALNARPIKKVAEAKARKKMRAVARLEKIKKKAGLINDDSDKSEKDKAEEIAKLMRKVSKKQKTKPKVTLVVASGSNKGLSGRPKGVKGKYKMVDGVMKNEQRALKRIAKKHHKKKKRN